MNRSLDFWLRFYAIISHLVLKTAHFQCYDCFTDLFVDLFSSISVHVVYFI